MSDNKLQPFVKWVGGKRQLLDILRLFIPKDINNYFEPFIGGGALFLDLVPRRAFISDVNIELITTWNIIKNNPKSLTSLLDTYVKNHNKQGRDFYYNIRHLDPAKLQEVELAARFIYLNKTCFNGIYRVNRDNIFNTPFNNKEIIKSSTLYNQENIMNISKFLNENTIYISNNDFEEILDSANEGDFIFLDPPYDFDNKGFDSYTSGSFGKNGQERLHEFLIKADRKGIKWILTNHNTELINKLYKNFNNYKVPVNRFINSNANDRQNSTFETIIYNFNLSREQEYKLNQELYFKELKATSYILKKYVSWDKINEFLEFNKDKIKNLNNLLSPNIKEFNVNLNNLFDKHRDSLELIPMLLANNKIEHNNTAKFTYVNNNRKEIEYNYNNKELVFEFINESGLLTNLFLNPEICDIKTYIYGVKLGLSSHDKKNKSGQFMNDLIDKILTEKVIYFDKEVKQNKILGQASLKEDKRFDFVFKIGEITYCLECNFFNGSGSKLNSELPRFIRLEEKLKDFKNYEFIYVADGPGLRNNKEIVLNAMDKIKNMFNITRFEEFLDKISKTWWK
ncbi:DpnII family type II restriction endonuclease [Spiroplasma endosymbiont of Aspidapion aeneum]|uniref:DpnII family type II restriction endonuclease n=1 Tax=Spiroplasma endosymbiont of Aspidapion aeneum TaxID=3066276 RepID=UPI00313BBA7F